MNSLQIVSDPDILGGTPVFAGTRVPVRVLFEHLEAGDPLDVFLRDFPTVKRELAVAVLKEARTAVAPESYLEFRASRGMGWLEEWRAIGNSGRAI